MKLDGRLQVCLWFLIVSGIQVGVWAQFFPLSFYESFPGMGRSWVSVDGPFNEHLVRDVGGAYLALATVSVIAVLTRVKAALQAAAAAWLVAQVPHFIYHMAHLHDFATLSDKVGNVVVLGLLVLVPAYVLVRTLRDPPAA